MTDFHGCNEVSWSPIFICLEYPIYCTTMCTADAQIIFPGQQWKSLCSLAVKVESWTNADFMMRRPQVKGNRAWGLYICLRELFHQVPGFYTGS